VPYPQVSELSWSPEMGISLVPLAFTALSVQEQNVQARSEQRLKASAALQHFPTLVFRLWVLHSYDANAGPPTLNVFVLIVSPVLFLDLRMVFFRTGCVKADALRINGYCLFVGMRLSRALFRIRLGNSSGSYFLQMPRQRLFWLKKRF